MKKLVSTLILLSLIGCNTFQTSNPEPVTDPQLKIGCSAYEGRDWEKCVIKLFGNYGKIINTPPTKKLVDTKRESEKFVIYQYELCLGDGSFCIDDYDRKYDPTTWAVIKPHLITGSIALLVGIVGGISVSGR